MTITLTAHHFQDLASGDTIEMPAARIKLDASHADLMVSLGRAMLSRDGAVSPFPTDGSAGALHFLAISANAEASNRDE